MTPGSADWLVQAANIALGDSAWGRTVVLSAPAARADVRDTERA